jgi:hypothetical protein
VSKWNCPPTISTTLICLLVTAAAEAAQSQLLPCSCSVPSLRLRVAVAALRERRTVDGRPRKPTSMASGLSAAAALLLHLHFHLLLLLSPSAAQPGEPPCPSIPAPILISKDSLFLFFCLRRRRPSSTPLYAFIHTHSQCHSRGESCEIASPGMCISTLTPCSILGSP